MQDDEKAATQAEDTALKSEEAQPTETEKTPPEDAKPESDKPKKPAWFTRVIAREAAEKRDAKREAESLKSQLAAVLQERAEGKPAQSLTQADIEMKAAELAAQREFNKECNRIAEEGSEEYEDFEAAVGSLAQIGGDNYQKLLRIVADDLPDAHKVLYHLGQNPEEAEQLLSLPPTKMARAVAKLEDKLREPAKTISNAPDPITPLKAKASKAFDPNDPQADRNEWSKWREKNRRKR